MPFLLRSFFLPNPFLKFQVLSPSPTSTISHHKPSLFSIENPHREEPFNRSRISNLACGFGRERKP
ncbi:hypothetical protein HKD37_02G004607 [Glycine soja]